MPRRRKALLLLALALLACGLLVVFSCKEEPSYNGRLLSHWVAMHGQHPRYELVPMYPVILDPIGQKEPANAIRQIGTKALPYLLDWIDYEPGRAWQEKVQTVAGRLPRWLRQSRPIIWMCGRSKDEQALREQAENALRALEDLGPTAYPVIPELARRANRASSPGAKHLALMALGGMGAEASSAIATALSSPARTDSPFCSYWKSIYLTNQTTGKVSAMVDHMSVGGLENTNEAFAFQSALTFYYLTPRPPIAVPLLTKAVQDPRPNLRIVASAALGEFGVSARAALPVLTNALHDPILAVRFSASNAIARITSAAATNTPSR